MRSTSRCTATFQPQPGSTAVTFIGSWLRTLAKPECISAQTERASARAAGSAGQRAFSGKRSARYSEIDRESQTVMSPSTSVGTLPAGEYWAICAAKPGVPSRTGISSNAMPAWRSSSQGRSDQDE
ncbi:hypothetical protein D3C87_1244570 [compost metagenome]